MASVQMLPSAVALGAGAAEAWLARQDAITPARQVDQTKQRSLWFTVAALGGGLVLNARARSAKQQDVAEGLLYGSMALLGRRIGVMAEQRFQESNIAGGAVTALPGGYAAPRVFEPMFRPQVLSGGNVRVTRSMNSSI